MANEFDEFNGDDFGAGGFQKETAELVPEDFTNWEAELVRSGDMTAELGVDVARDFQNLGINTTEIRDFQLWAKENPAELAIRVQQWGRNPAVETVLKSTGLLPENIDALFEAGLETKEQQIARYQALAAQRTVQNISDDPELEDAYNKAYGVSIDPDSASGMRIIEDLKQSPYISKYLEAMQYGRGGTLTGITFSSDGPIFEWDTPDPGDFGRGSVWSGRSQRDLYDVNTRELYAMPSGGDIFNTKRDYNARQIQLPNDLWISVYDKHGSDIFDSYYRSDLGYQLDANGITFSNGTKLTDAEAMARLGRDLPKERRFTDLQNKLENNQINLIQFASQSGIEWDSVSPTVYDMATGLSDAYKAAVDDKGNKLYQSVTIEKGVETEALFNIRRDGDGNIVIQVGEDRQVTPGEFRSFYNLQGEQSDKVVKYGEDKGFWGGIGDWITEGMRASAEDKEFIKSIPVIGTPLVVQDAVLGWMSDTWRSVAAPIGTAITIREVAAPEFARMGQQEKFFTNVTPEQAKQYGVPEGTSIADLVDKLVKEYQSTNTYEQKLTNYERSVSLIDQVILDVALSLIPIGGIPGAQAAVSFINRTSAVSKAAARAKVAEETLTKLGTKSPNLTKAQDELNAATRALRQAKVDLAHFVRGTPTQTERISEAIKAGGAATKERAAIVEKGLSLEERGKGLSNKEIARIIELDQVIDDSANLARIYSMGEVDVLKSTLARMNVVETTAEMARLQSFDDLAKTVFREDNYAKMAGYLGETEAGRVILNNLNAIGTKSDSIHNAAFLLSYEKALGKTLTIVETAGVRKLGRVLDVNKNFGSPLVKNVEYIGEAVDPRRMPFITALGDVLMNPDLYRFTSGALKGKLVSQSRQVKAIQDLVEVRRLNMLKSEKLDMSLIDLDDGAHYWHDMAIGKLSSDPAARRKYLHMSEGLADGVKYEYDYLKVLDHIIDSAYNMVARKNFVNAVKTMGSENPAIKEALATVEGLKSKAKILDDIATELSNTGVVANPERVKSISSAVYKALMDNEPTGDVLNKITQRQRTLANSVAKFENEADILGKIPGIKGVSGTEGLSFRPEVGQELAKALAPYSKIPILDKGIDILTDVNSVLRTSLTAYDLGAPMIHGLPLLYTRPDVWAKGLAAQFKAMLRIEDKSGNWFAGFVDQNKAVIRQMVLDGHVNLSNSQFMEGANLIEKLPSFTMIPQVTRKAEAAFNAFVDTSKVELWKAMYRPNMSATEKAAIGDYIEKILGTLDSSKLGLSARQAKIETLLFFAPRYYRSNLALNADIFRGGVRGTQAIEKLARIHMGHHMAYMAMCTAVGQEPILDPTDTRYLKFKVGEVWIGDIGWTRGEYQFLGRMISDVANGYVDRIPQRMVRFGEGKMSRVAGVIKDTAAGKNFIGESWWSEDASGWGNVASWLGQEVVMSSLPLSVQNLFNDAPYVSNMDRGVMFAAEFFGKGAVPEQPYMRMVDVVNKMSQDRHGVSYRELSMQGEQGIQSQIDIMNSEEVKKIERDIEQLNRDKGASWLNLGEQQSLRAIPERNAAQETRCNDLALLYEDWTAGLIGDYDKRVREREIEKEYSDTVKDLQKQYPAYYANIKDFKIEAPAGSVPAIVNYYRYKDEVLYNNTVYSDDFQKKLQGKTEEEQDEIFYAALEKIRTDYIMDVGKGDKAEGMKVYKQMRALALADKGFPDGYIVKKVDMDELSMTRDPITNKNYWDYSGDKTKEGELARLTFLYDNPEIEANLYVHGYIKTLQTLDAYDLASVKIRDLGLQKGVPLPLDRRNDTMQYMWDRYNQLREGISYKDMSEEALNLSSTVSNIAYRIKALEAGISQAVTDEQKEKLITDIYSTVAQLRDVAGQVKEKSGNEYEALKQLVDIYLKENETRVARVKAYVPLPKLE